ncbi:MAG: hypothetical protein IJX89_04005 [Alphaproteobacteria bacterium]|nr:hypothetical protein [Alphaproteobacteria bacterium]
MKKTIAIFLLSITTANAAELTVSTSVREAWGNAEMNYCGTNNIPEACIGEAVNKNCANKKIYSARYQKKGKYDDEFANLIMMAREINEHGALFCPTQADGQNNDQKGYTAYYEPNGNDNCIWLCQAKWTGDRCATSTENFTDACNIVPFTRNDYNDVTAVHDIHKKAKNNIENQIEFFYINDYQKCSYKDDDGDIKSKARNEHDMALVLTKFLTSGNGAFARQMIIQSHRTGKKSSDILIYPASKSIEILVCKNGYTPNLSNTDCEPIDKTKCDIAIASTKMCIGWSYSNMNPEIHELTESDNCYKYRCKQSGYAFNSITDLSCTECPSNKRSGIHPRNNTCTKCETGTMFNKSTGECDNNVIGLSKTDMMYGRNKTKNSQKKLNDQCWTQANDPDKYKNCVLGKE